MPGGTGEGGKMFGQVGVGAPKATRFAVLAKSLFCCRPFVVTEPTWLSMF